MAQQEELFSRERYNDPEVLIPRSMGFPVNEVLGVKEYLRVCRYENIDQYYGINSNGNATTDDTYDRGPERWGGHLHNSTEPLEGFLRGFPILTDDAGNKIRAIHLHVLWDDVDASSIVVPLRDVDEIYRYEALYSELLAEEHEISGGLYSKSTIFEVPILKRQKSGEFICKAANAQDLYNARLELHLAPMQIYGQGLFSTNPSKPIHYRI